MKGICDLVRETCNKVTQQAKLLKINHENLKILASEITNPEKFQNVDWRDFEGHYFDSSNEEAVVDYIFILDTLNFCFWPSPVPWEYENLAKSLRELLKQDPTSLQPKNLIKMDLPTFKKVVFLDIDFPLLEERYRLVQESCYECIKHFDGKFSNVVKAAAQSAEEV